MKAGKIPPDLSLEGVLIDFGHTLAYIVEEEDMKYREEIVSIHKKHGCNKTSTNYRLF